MLLPLDSYRYAIESLFFRLYIFTVFFHQTNTMNRGNDQWSQTTVYFFLHLWMLSLFLCVNGVKTESKYQPQIHKICDEKRAGRKRLNSTMTLAVSHIFISFFFDLVDPMRLSHAIKLCIRCTNCERIYLFWLFFFLFNIIFVYQYNWITEWSKMTEVDSYVVWCFALNSACG